MKDAKYIIKRVIIGTLIALLVMFLKNNVFAANCTNGTIAAGYYYNGWNSFTNNFSISPNVVSSVRINFSNSNIKNNQLFLSGTLNLESNINGSVSSNPTILVRYGTSSNYLDISSSCSFYTTRKNYPELFDTQWTTNFACSYTGTNTSANWLQLYVTTSNQYITKGSYSNLCLQISPNSTDQIINNDNQNAIDIATDMYNYYSSLWDKSNVQEEILLDAIEAAQDTITDQLADIASGITYSEPSEEALEDFNDDINDYFDNLGPDGTASTITDVLLDFVIDFTEAFTDLQCNAYSFPPLFGYTLTFPCIDLEDYLGETLWEIIDYLFCFLFIFYWLRQLVHIIYNWLELKDGDPLG